MTDSRMSRGALIGAGMAFAFGVRALDALAADSATTATCLLTPEVTEGPYWIDNRLTRRDVRAGRRGLPVLLELTILNARSCKPIRAADVEIWHADAAGEYSGYDAGAGGPGGPGGHATPTSVTRYLRGHQRTDAAGLATFLTIFPGWYRGRTPHIHLKVHAGGPAARVVHTGQIFFDEAITAQVYRRGAYAGRGQADTPHSRDSIFAQAGGSRAVVKLSSREGGGYVGKIVLGVAV